MAEFDPEVCERNRQSRLHKGEVLRPQVLVAHTQRLKGSSRVTNAWRTIFYQAPQPPLFFASETICPTVRRQKGKKKSSSFSTVLQQDEWKNKLTPNIVKIHTQTGLQKVLHQSCLHACVGLELVVKRASVDESKPMCECRREPIKVRV